MSRTSRREPPTECPLASLGRNTPSSFDSQIYHHPLSTSPLNPQVYQMSRKSPILNIPTSNTIFTPTLHHTGRHHDQFPVYANYQSVPQQRQIVDLSCASRNISRQPPKTEEHDFTPVSSIISYHDRISSVDKGNNSDKFDIGHHTQKDKYSLEDKMGKLYVHNATNTRQSYSDRSERYYLEENMDNIYLSKTECLKPKNISKNCYLRQIGASSPSETSGSDRYFGNQVCKSPTLSIRTSNKSEIYSVNNGREIMKQSIPISHIYVGDDKCDVERFSPSMDQGYHTLVSPSPSGISQPTASTGKCSKTQFGVYFQTLSDDIVIKIFKWLDVRDLCSLSQVCKRFANLVWKPVLWKFINLRGYNISGDKALKIIFRKLCNQSRHIYCDYVERVMLAGNCEISDKGVQLIARRCPELTHLQIENSFNITSGAISELVTRCTNLQHLDITGCSQIESINITSSFDLPRRLLIQYLDLTDCCSINDEGLRTIVNNCPQIIYLYLRRCILITDSGLKFVPSFCTGLRELSVSDCSSITDFGLYELAKLGATLRYLSVAKCDQVSDAGLKVIARRCYKLRYLNARGCEAVSDDSIIVLAHSCSRLRALDIGKCDVSDAGLQALAESCPNLKKLSLRNCDMVTDRGVQCIAYYCRGLQQLNIQDCQISIDGYRAVKKYCKRCIIEHTNPGFC